MTEYCLPLSMSTRTARRYTDHSKRPVMGVLNRNCKGHPVPSQLLWLCFKSPNSYKTNQISSRSQRRRLNKILWDAFPYLEMRRGGALTAALAPHCSSSVPVAAHRALCSPRWKDGGGWLCWAAGQIHLKGACATCRITWFLVNPNMTWSLF